MSGLENEGSDPVAHHERRRFSLAALERARQHAHERGFTTSAMPRGVPGGGRCPREDGVPGAPGTTDPVVTSDGAAAALGPDVPADLHGVAEAGASAGERWVAMHGMAPMRRRWREPVAASGLMSEVVRAQHWDTPAAMGSVLAKWPQIVGDLVAHCEVETFEDRKLVVRCSSTSWAKQLQLLLPQIEANIDRVVGPGVVQQVIVRGPAAPSWRKGPWSVPGRGPRDTYG